MNTEQYISQVITDEELSSIVPGQFNILKAPRGWGKTTFMFDDRILNFSRAKKNVLYLIHNTLMRDRIVESNIENAVALESSDDINAWLEHRKQKNLHLIEEDDDRVHVMCYQTFAALLRKQGTDWLKDIDLIIWDEFDDVHAYYMKDIKMLKKALPIFSEDRLASLLQEGNPNSVVNFVYQIKVNILDPQKIRLLAISATPERAALLFRDYINYILKGQLEEKYYAEETIFINSICEAIKNGTFIKGRKYWCHTPRVTDAFRIANIGEAYGFNTLVLWAEKNQQWKHLMTDERKEMLRRIQNEEDLPEKYDMVIITAYGSRGLNVYDTSFQDWVCDSSEYEALGQYMRARFVPARQYLLTSAKGLIDFIRNGFAEDYYDWHSLAELRELIKEKPIFDKKNNKRLPSFNAVTKEYPDLFEKRVYGRARLVQYKMKSVA